MIANLGHWVLAGALVLLGVGGCTADGSTVATATSASITGPKISYAYDPLGRLIQVAQPDGTGVQYDYDAVGNITAIRRLATDTLSIVDFVPSGGVIGSTVSIYGSGFAATPSANTVTLNGVAAMVTSASPTSLVISVPPGAMTGKIAVTTSATATSAADYMVLSATTAPGIAGFTPPTGIQGTVISITGMNFQPVVADNRVIIGGQLAQVVKDATSPSPTLLKAIVPSSAATGQIEVDTRFGSALSSADFFALPTGVNASDIEATGQVAVNGPSLGLTTTTPGKKIMLVFNALTGQRLHLVASSGTFASLFTADVYNSSGVKLQSLNMSDNAVGDFSTPAAVDGPYSIVINPIASDKGTVHLGMVADITGAITLDGGTALALNPGQNAHLSFTALATTGYGLALSGLAFVPSTGGPSVTATLRNVAGTSLGTCTMPGTTNCEFDPSLFTAAGTYFIDLDPSGVAAASFSAQLSDDTTGALTLDAAPSTIDIARAGQTARYTFSGSAGQAMTVVLTSDMLDDGNASTINATQVLVLQPSGSSVASTTISTGAAGATIDAMLPVAGTYTLVIKPGGLDAGTLSVQLKSYLTGPLAVDGTTPVSLSSGRNARLTFTAQANTGYGLALTSLAFTPSTGSPMLTATLRSSAGTALASCQFTASSSCDFDASLFAAAGSYLLDFDPAGLVSASFNAVLSTDATGTVVIDAASPTTVTIVRPGQNARFTFAGTAGKSVTVVLSGSTIDDGNPSTLPSTQVLVLRPSGVTLGSSSFNAATGGVAIDATLPDTGTYSVVLRPNELNTGTVGLQVVSTTAGTFTVDGTTAVALEAGQNGQYTFTAQANTGYGLALTNLVFTPATAAPPPAVNVTLRTSAGASLATCTFTTSGSCDFAPNLFTATGSYSLGFDPTGIVATSFTGLLSTDLGGTLVIDAAPTAVTFARAGQNARYSFSGTAGQLVKVVITGNTLDDGNPATVNSTQLAVFKPSSPTVSPIGNIGFNTVTSSATLNLTLPETGSYVILLNPAGLDAGSLNLGVAHQ